MVTAPPPACISGRCSKTVTSCPSRSNPRAMEMPPTPAPTTRTRRLRRVDGGFSADRQQLPDERPSPAGSRGWLSSPFLPTPQICDEPGPAEHHGPSVGSVPPSADSAPVGPGEAGLTKQTLQPGLADVNLPAGGVSASGRGDVDVVKVARPHILSGRRACSRRRARLHLAARIEPRS